MDKKILEEEYKKFLKNEFPKAPEEDELYDLFAELVLLDGHIAGLVSSYLANCNINFELLDVDDEFNELANNIKIDSKSSVELNERKKQLDKLVHIIKEMEGLI